MRMPDDAFKIGILVLVGFALALAVAWYLHYCYQEISGTAEVVIDPLTWIEDSGKSNEDVGRALALMLQTRLASLTEDLRNAQTGLTSTSPETAPVVVTPIGGGGVVAPIGGLRLFGQDVVLRVGLVTPVDMKLAVGGVEVGGVIPWLQRRLSNRRTLHFTIYSRAGEAQVFGSIAPLRLEKERLWLQVKTDTEKAPSLDLVIDRLAHEIIRLRLAEDKSNQVGLLRSSEFVTLSTALVEAAEYNRDVQAGRPSESEFAGLLPGVRDICDKVPGWIELGYFTAWLADKSHDNVSASLYYNRVVLKLDASKQSAFIDLIKHRLEELQPAEIASGPAIVESTKASVDYSPEIKRVRDAGPEGSVVGQALATALEFQIAKATHHDEQISARYIYYVARIPPQSTDSGAVIADGIRALTKEGAVEESVWPYVAGQYAAKPPAAVRSAKRFRITNAKEIKGLNALKNALVANGPVVAGIPVYPSAMQDIPAKTGVLPLPGPKEKLIGGHAVVIVGYDDKQKRVKFVNSWGSAWGDHGFGYLSYEYVEKYMSEA